MRSWCPDCCLYTRRTADGRCLSCVGREASRRRFVGDAEPDPRPERRPGEPSWRCLHCMRWRCDAPLSLCGECQGEYLRAAVGMPAAGAGEWDAA